MVAYSRRNNMREKTVTRRTRLVLSEELWKRATRFVLVLMILLIVITPVTQSIWSGDNFLQGHDDTEYTLLLLLMFASLVLLLSRSKQSDIREFLFRLKGWLVFLLRALWDEGLPFNTGVLSTSATFLCTRPCEAASFNLPLLI